MISDAAATTTTERITMFRIHNAGSPLSCPVYSEQKLKELGCNTALSMTEIRTVQHAESYFAIPEGESEHESIPECVLVQLRELYAGSARVYRDGFRDGAN